MFERHDDNTPNFSCETRTTPSWRFSRELAPRRTSKRCSLQRRTDALLYFAGHGTSHPDDVSLCTYDGTVATPGVKLSEVLAMVGRSAVREVVIVLDCCFSGAAGGVPQLGAEGSFLTPGLAILTASRDDQTAAETPSSRGAFSTFLGGALDGGAADVLGKVTIAGLYAYLDECSRRAGISARSSRPTLIASANCDAVYRARRTRFSASFQRGSRAPTSSTLSTRRTNLTPNPHMRRTKKSSMACNSVDRRSSSNPSAKITCTHAANELDLMPSRTPSASCIDKWPETKDCDRSSRMLRPPIHPSIRPPLRR